MYRLPGAAVPAASGSIAFRGIGTGRYAVGNGAAAAKVPA
jgi:hypothetical protein